MSKRYQPLKEFGRSMKKPKLEVSINKNPPGASTSKPKSPSQKPPSKAVDDLWDDEEDDVLLLATQAAESQSFAARKTKEPDHRVVDITDSEITFSEFEPKIVQHSTQQPPPPTENLFSQMFDEDDEDIATLAAAIEKDAKRHEEGSKAPAKEDDEEAIFKTPALPRRTYPRDDTSDDEPGSSTTRQPKLPVSQFVSGKMFSESNEPGASTKQKVKPVPEASERVGKESRPQFEPMLIDVDDEPGPSTRRMTTMPITELAERVSKISRPQFEDLPEGMLIDVDEPGPSSIQKKSMPEAGKLSSSKESEDSDQVKDLLKRLQALENENAKLNRDLNTVKDTMQTKSGEASVLREELRQAKQKLDELKMAKMFQTETVSAESKKKIEELTKKVHDKEAELQLKNMECSVLKMRQADETRRFETSTTTTTTTPRDTTTVPNVDDDDDPNDEESPVDETRLTTFADMVWCQPELRIECEALIPRDYIFESVIPEPTKLRRKWNTLIQAELKEMQRLLAKVQIDVYNVPEATSNEIIASVLKVFQDFSVYVNDLYYGYNEKVLPDHLCNVLDPKNIRPLGCMHFTTELFPGERVINMRRYVALLAVICDRSPKVARALLSAMHEEKPILNIAIDFINRIGFSLEAFPYFGIFEGFALILRTALYHLDPDDDEDKPFTELLFKLFKTLVFARPGPWTMYELSFCVLDIHERFPSMLEWFCVNSAPETFTSDRQKGVYRFSNESCVLQVYCGLTESSFPLYVPLTEEIFDLQAKMCLNHIRLVFYCVTEAPDFIEKILSAYKEDDDDDIDEEFFKQWINKFSGSDDAYNFFFKQSNSTETSAKNDQEEKEEEDVAGKTTTSAGHTADVGDENHSTNKDTIESSCKEKPNEQSTTSKKAAEDGGRTSSTGHKNVGDEQSSTSKETSKENPCLSVESRALSTTYETFRDEQPTTSKKAAEAASKEFLRIDQPTGSVSKKPEESEEKPDTATSATLDADGGDDDAAKTSTQCQCFEQLCLSAVRMTWVSLRQWLRMVKLIEVDRVRVISGVAVHLIYFLFCDKYLTCLLREDEDTTKHLIYLLYHWWIEHKEDLEFTEVQEEMLQKIKNSPIIPKLFCEEEDHPENVAKDYAEWCRLSGLPYNPEALDLERALKNLNLMEEATDVDTFMDFMKPPNLDLKSFEFHGFPDDDVL